MRAHTQYQFTIDSSFFAQCFFLFVWRWRNDKWNGPTSQPTTTHHRPQTILLGIYCAFSHVLGWRLLPFSQKNKYKSKTRILDVVPGNDSPNCNIHPLSHYQFGGRQDQHHLGQQQHRVNGCVCVAGEPFKRHETTNNQKR